ncbi:MAG: GMC family oxidoreductase N-terminal domain-containing protein [Pseudomonadota bacterium]
MTDRADGHNGQQFDYVVVGGGSAGCVVAGLLSANPQRTVCLIEAGPPDDDPRIRVPLGLMGLIGNPRFDWCYRSEAHAHLNGRQVSVPRGKTLGGSGSINSMVYIRGRPSDYDAWAEQGCDGWHWQAVLDRFRAAENNGRLRDSALHGTAGPLYVEDLPSPHPMLRKLLAAGAAAGVPANDDFNGPRQEGLGNYQTTMHRGRRWSAADAYLRPALGRANLTVLTDTDVERVDVVDGRARALHVLSLGQRRRIGVGRELVLCAGAIGSPALLLRSGVGPAADLAGHGIEVALDLPGVGANLHDHPAVGMHYGGGDDGYALSLATLGQNLAAPFRYLASRRGLFASNTVEGGGFARTRELLDEPDVQFHFIPARVGHEGGMVTWGRGYYSDVCLLKPRSRGRLTLRSPRAGDAPAIDLNLLADDADERALLRGVRLLRKILSHAALSGGGARELVPGDAVGDTDDELRAFVHSRLGTAYHPVGTCRMGAADDARSVVDPRLRVIGLANVRVADASVMPEIVAGNTNAATMMIGAAAAEFVDTDARGAVAA